MKFNPKGRYVVGVTVDPDAHAHEDMLLQGIFLAFMHTAYDGSLSQPNVPITVIIWREGDDGRSPYNIGHAHVLEHSTNMFEKEIHLLEHGKSPVDLSKNAGGLALFLAIGSPTFCQAFINYIATNDDGVSAKSWGLHYMRRLTTAKLGDALWYDTATPGEFFYEDLGTMIQNFDKDMAAA